MGLRQIISGGQTGVDRAALDAALAAGFPCGGWCPAGRLAEDGTIAARYPLEELPGAGYVERTLQNVADSDATLVIAFGKPTGGTARTIAFCLQLDRPHLVIDAETCRMDEAIARVQRFILDEDIGRLNMAGPRESGEPRGYAYARALVDGVLAAAARSPGRADFDPGTEGT